VAFLSGVVTITSSPLLNTKSFIYSPLKIKLHNPQL